MSAEGWPQLELRHLLALQAVSREGSFAAAAEALGYTQSAISQQIAALERTIGQRFPEIELEVTESPDDAELYAQLERAELDLCIGLVPAPEGPFDALEIMRDPYVLLVSSESPLADRAGRPELTEIAELSLIGFRQCRQERWLESQLHANAVRPRWVFRPDDNA